MLLIVLVTVFSMAWYKIEMQRSPVIYHGISYSSLVFSMYAQLPKGPCLRQEDTNDSWDIPQYTTLN